MIPQRMLSSEICGNGLKNRVTACRKRLRLKRVTQRSHVNNDSGELFPETTPSVSDCPDYAADKRSGVPRDYLTPFAGAEPAETQTLLRVAEQEVGIT
jgi:hypothetical protein